MLYAFCLMQDALNASLEADVASFEAVQDLGLNNSTRIQKLTRSISVNEVALASLKGEFHKQNAELIAAEDELAKLRNALAKKVSKFWDQQRGCPLSEI